MHRSVAPLRCLGGISPPPAGDLESVEPVDSQITRPLPKMAYASKTDTTNARKNTMTY